MKKKLFSVIKVVMASPKTWTVVCFCSDNAVQAVPTTWINGDTCLWPALPREKLNNALKNCEYNSCWPMHKVRIFRDSTYEDYATARTKAAKAEYSSDLNSDPDVRRSRKRRTFTSSESEDESRIKKKPKKKAINLPTPPSWNMPTVLLDYEDMNNTIDTNGSFIRESMEITAAAANFSGANLKETEDVSEITDDKHNCKRNSQILYNIQSLLIEVNERLIEVNNKLSANPQQSLEGPSVDDVLERISIELPVDSEEKLENLEQFLASTENYKSLVQYFAKMGGINLCDFVKRCLGPIMSDSMAMAYSFIGRKGKLNFSKLQLSKAVIESSERTGLQKTRKETEYAVALWLRKSKERCMKRI
ncbi:uncharacterized protein LOC126891722 [Diabrotica virgifera virgifera]|uniref:DUF4806 domain-containing protein n=1 Tax=Diabrotica virgifera virgifera TaxID=50390 RepID=A0ABM5L3E3_DIAVI|nr:uncharacterized protein LOC126891722 [Diabrotica virgifera virgifera]